jgi:hypothetical protein
MMLSTEDVKTTFSQLDAIKHIGPKIAAFTLRDLSFLRDVREGSVSWFAALPEGRQAYSMPIDVHVYDASRETKASRLPPDMLSTKFSPTWTCTSQAAWTSCGGLGSAASTPETSTSSGSVTPGKTWTRKAIPHTARRLQPLAGAETPVPLPGSV